MDLAFYEDRYGYLLRVEISKNASVRKKFFKAAPTSTMQDEHNKQGKNPPVRVLHRRGACELKRAIEDHRGSNIIILYSKE